MLANDRALRQVAAVSERYRDFIVHERGPGDWCGRRLTASGRVVVRGKTAAEVRAKVDALLGVG